MGSTGATLSGSFSGASGRINSTGIVWGTNSSLIDDPTTNSASLNWAYDDTNVGNVASGSINGTLTSLSESTTYYYRAFVAEYNENTGEYEYRYGSKYSITTSAAQPSVGHSWLELPAYTKSLMSGTTSSSLSDLYEVTHWATMGGKQQRNYTCLYDPSMYASYWVAYPLCSAHLGSGSLSSFSYDPDVPESKQTNVTSGAYGVNIATTNYPSNLYSRGHQIPNADRNGVSAMQSQTYYITNVTPQIQNGFNSPLWSDLEDAVRAQTSSTDTVYVVTGAAFRKKGGSESITTITNTRDSKVLPVPNYYWKVVLKVTRSGGNITAAKAIGVWIPHQDLKGHSYTEYVCSVDQIETWTGFDFFPNLPGDNDSGIEKAAESNSSWSSFAGTSQSNNSISGVSDQNWGTL